jgi:hypothetical protein
MRHKFVPLPLSQTINGAWGGCESCGVLNTSGLPGCLKDEAAGNFKFKYLLMFVADTSDARKLIS